jgi:ribosomal protein S8
MNLNLEKIREALCTLMCAEVKIMPLNGKLLAVETPFYFADGDPYQIYIKEMAGGILRLTDMGHTLMHLSYENDIDKFREGTRGKIFEQIKAETFIEEENGEFYLETPVDNLGLNIFRLGQALTKINDLTFLNRARVESTFYGDLKEQILKIVGEEYIKEEYYFEEMENAKDYPIDYRIEGKHAPLFLFGIPNKDKARLTTIVLERLLRVITDFDSLLIFSDLGVIPKPDLARLSNAGGEIIASLDAEADFSRKLLRKIKMN